MALLNDIGVEISKRQVVRLLAEPLDGLVAEGQEALRAGLATARWVTVDDTAARHARKDGFTTQVGVTLKDGQDSTVSGANREHDQAAAGSVFAMPRSSRNPSGAKALSAFQR